LRESDLPATWQEFEEYVESMVEARTGGIRKAEKTGPRTYERPRSRRQSGCTNAASWRVLRMPAGPPRFELAKRCGDDTREILSEEAVGQ